MGIRLKIGFLASLLITAGFFFGLICRQVGQAYGLLLPSSQDLFALLLRFLVSALALTVCAGLAATLLRPLKMACLAFGLSAGAMLVGWEFSLVSGIMALIYFLAASLYARGVARDMNQRITFSESSARVGRGMLLTTLALVVSGSFYASYAAHIAREGFTVPREYIQDMGQLVEQQVGAGLPELLREVVLSRLRESFETILGEYIEGLLMPYERYIPAALSFAVLITLMPILRLLSWVPTVVLSAVHAVLKALGITRIVHETVKVQWLVLE